MKLIDRILYIDRLKRIKGTPDMMEKHLKVDRTKGQS